jgi:hypothetical protein
MSDQETKKPTGLKGLKLKTTVVKRGPEEPLPETLALVAESSVPQPFAGSVQAPKAPTMFGKTLKQPVQASVKQPIVRPNTTVRLNKPKSASVMFPVKPVQPVQTVKPVLETADQLLEPPAEPLIEPSMEQLAKEESAKEEPAKEEVSSLLPPVVLPKLEELHDLIDLDESADPYVLEDPSIYYPQDRKGFTRYATAYYASQFALPRIVNKKINPNACNEMELQTYKYQAFVREFMRQGSPYRGILVYHGLGSGKTCTSIAAAEALYGQADKKIIILTPISLRENFLNEMMFCGFRHYRLKNTWIPFPLKDESTKLFARQVLHMSDALVASISKRSPEKQVIWLPDLSKPESESNFEDLQDWERSAIREQLYSILDNKYTFIGYTGFTAKRMFEIATNDPTFFDNSVIIIDEVHNITRLITGKLERTLRPPKEGKSLKYYEPVPIGTWTPKFEKDDYSRAFLLYMLLAKAKNSKLIALSGTPIVNQPTEIGILGNILHGYFSSAEDILQTTDKQRLARANAILQQHPRVNYYTIEEKTGVSVLFYTILDEGYVKLFDESTKTLKGMKYVGVEEATPHTIQDLHFEIVQRLADEKILLRNQPTFKALPLFPPTVEEFTDIFINKEDLKVKNPLAFVKRFSGLVSYYKGSKEELMPKIVSDIVVECPFSEVGLGAYSKSRLKELAEKPKKKAAYDEASALDEQESSSYRFRSRATCNFAFPKDIERPFPGKKEDLDAAIGTEVPLVGDTITDLAVEPSGVAELEAAELTESAVAQANNKDDETSLDSPTVYVKPYKERLAEAISALNARKASLFSMDPSKPPEQQLQTYSGKFAKILQNIQASAGSSLLYSVFKTVEGIGVFSMALDANGFAPIKLVGSDQDLRFDEETLKSIQTAPEQPRYILYSGGESLRVRQTLINLFNMRIDKLPTKIAEVLEQSPLRITQNLHGEVCRVFMITAAGAEGLSLRNVRSVHIMEPYWNKVRTDQVKGRAVRICSHADLPYDEDPAKNERVVEVFTYISVFSKTMQIDQTLITQDDSKTSDQHILFLAETKEKVSSDFLCHMKAAAVDCKLNEADNESTIGCFIETKGTVEDFLYDPRINEDIILTDSSYTLSDFSFCRSSDQQQQQQTQQQQQQQTQQQQQPKPQTQQLREVKVQKNPKTGETFHVTKDPKTGRIFWYKTSDILYATPIYEQVINPSTGKPSIKPYGKD